MSSDEDKRFYSRERDDVQEILTSNYTEIDSKLTKRFNTHGKIFQPRKKTVKSPTLEEEREMRKKESYKEGMLGGIQRVLATYIARLDRDQGDIIGPVEIKSVTNYVIIVLIALLIFDDPRMSLRNDLRLFPILLDLYTLTRAALLAASLFARFSFWRRCTS